MRIGRRQGLHALQRMIRAGVVDEDGLVVLPPAHCSRTESDSCSNVVLLVEAGNDTANVGTAAMWALDAVGWFGESPIAAMVAPWCSEPKGRDRDFGAGL
jgi:hypothetical protein